MGRGMEAMSQCLRAWMKAEETSAAALAERLGYRSKTTVLRLLHGKSSADSCRQLYEKLRPGLSLDWQVRFERALRVERTGPARYAVLEALERRLFRPGEEESLPLSAWPLPPFVTRGQILLLGRCGKQSWAEGWLSLAGIGVTQYLTENELLTVPSVLPFLIGHMTELRYQAVLVRGDGPDALPWNTAFFMADGRAYLLYWDGEKASWLGLPGGADSLRRLLSGLEKAGLTPLYRFDQLKNGSDYIRFTEKAYQMERNRAALILKPTPGMQMMPAEAVKQSFEDYLARNLEPVSAARETLIRTYEQRVGNFYGRARPTRLILSFRAMEEFARTGVMADQFFACRPFTAAERMQILQALRRFSQKPGVSLLFRDGPAWPVSAEAYHGVGALFYPSAASYNSDQETYRELFLPGQAFYDLTEGLMRGMAPDAEMPDAGAAFDALTAACR
ncbi:MAG: hypothetical protein J5472_02605 [Clostridia bacterium]|nr:hypothetical protein [Clostridia bacterium]